MPPRRWAPSGAGHRRRAGAARTRGRRPARALQDDAGLLRTRGGIVAAERLSEGDDLSLRALAFIERTTVAEQRRRALRENAARACRDENVAEIVRLVLGPSRRERRDGGDNVIKRERRRSLMAQTPEERAQARL